MPNCPTLCGRDKPPSSIYEDWKSAEAFFITMTISKVLGGDSMKRYILGDFSRAPFKLEH